MIVKTDEELLNEFALQNLQICKLQAKIDELEELKASIVAKRDANFKIYEDRQKQKGRNIEIPKFPVKLEDLDLET